MRAVRLSTIPDFTVRILDQMSDDGEIYWMPTTVSAFGLYCNLDLLEENGLDPATDVTIEWKSEPSEIVAQMAAEDHVVAMLPQPLLQWPRTSSPICRSPLTSPKSGTAWTTAAS